MTDGSTVPSPTERRTDQAISVSHLSKRFGDRLAFDDVSFEVGRGEVFGFLGPNGAGKTTTVRTLGTLIAPSSGTASVAGLPLDPRERRRDPAADRGHARVARPVPAVERRREPRVFRRPVRGPGAEAAHRPGARGRQPRRPGRRCLRHAVQGPPPAGRPGAGAVERPGGALPRRADGRPRSGRGAGGPRAHPRAPTAGGDDLPDHAPAGGGGTALRSRRDPQHDPPHHRPTERAPRRDVHAIALDPDRSLRSPSPIASSAVCPASRAGARTGPTTSSPCQTRTPRLRPSPGRWWPPTRTSSPSSSHAIRSRTSTSS